MELYGRRRLTQNPLNDGAGSASLGGEYRTWALGAVVETEEVQPRHKQMWALVYYMSTHCFVYTAIGCRMTELQPFELSPPPPTRTEFG